MTWEQALIATVIVVDGVFTMRRVVGNSKEDKTLSAAMTTGVILFDIGVRGALSLVLHWGGFW